MSQLSHLPSFQIGDFFLLHLISKNIEEVSRIQREDIKDKLMRERCRLTMMLLGDDERAGGGFAPGFEAGLHRSSHSQVAGAACQTRRENF